MPRWSPDSVLALAPDDSSRRAAGPLSRPAPWSTSGATEDLVWGLCAGSGKNPYQVAVDLSGPAFKCSCPSRKFPCKHALGLLLLWSAGTVPDAAGPAAFARDWQESRRDKQEKTKARSAARTDSGDSASSAASGAGPDAASGLRDETAAARRLATRSERAAAGLADLQEWLRDQVRVGLASAAAPRPGAG
ncbi:MAG TPA: SWIM zinc finger family protein, partial [Trebonia sp.]